MLAFADHPGRPRPSPCCSAASPSAVSWPGFQSVDRVGDPVRAAAALLRGQLHPAQPRHRHRRRHRRRVRRRRPTCATFQAIYLGDAAQLPPGALPAARCRCATSRAGSSTDGRRPTAKVGYLAVVRRPAMATMTAAELRVVVRRLLAAQRRHAGVRARGRRDLDPGLGLRVRRQHAGDRAAPAGRAAAHRGPAPHPGDRGDGRGLGGVVAAARRRPGWSPAPSGATLLVAACASVFAFGETLLQPTIPALVNDLAPDHLRGRYNALSSGAFQLAADHRAADRRLPDRPRPRQRLHRHARRRLPALRRARRRPPRAPARPGSTASASPSSSPTRRRRRAHPKTAVPARWSEPSATRRPTRRRSPTTTSAPSRLLPVGLHQHRQHRRAQVERVVLPWRAAAAGAPASALGCRRVGDGLGCPTVRPPRPTRDSSLAGPPSDAAPSRCSRQATNWPSSLSETSCMTPRPNCAGLPVIARSVTHLDVGATRRGVGHGRA